MFILHDNMTCTDQHILSSSSSPPVIAVNVVSISIHRRYQQRRGSLCHYCRCHYVIVIVVAIIASPPVSPSPAPAPAPAPAARAPPPSHHVPVYYAGTRTSRVRVRVRVQVYNTRTRTSTRQQVHTVRVRVPYEYVARRSLESRRLNSAPPGPACWTALRERTRTSSPGTSTVLVPNAGRATRAKPAAVS